MTRAGIHADGLLKNEEIYNAFDTNRLLKRPISVTITDKSGMAGIILWIHNKIGRGNLTLSKKHPGIEKIYKWINAQYNKGRVTSISDREMRGQVKLHLDKWLKESGFEI